MSNSLFALLILPVLAEALDGRRFSVAIPGMPLTLGGTLFIASGLTFAASGWKNFRKNKTFIGLFVVFLGCAGAAFFSDDVSGNVLRSGGLFLMLGGACGWATFLKRDSFRRLLDIFFVVLFTYWSGYVLYKTVLGEGLISYSVLWVEDEVRNHHVPGMNISISSVYVALRFFYVSNRLTLKGYLIFGIGLVCCLLLESRSNFFFTLLSFAVVIIVEKKRITTLAFVIVPLFVGMCLVAQFFISRNEDLYQRFDITDVAYQQQSAGYRLGFLDEGALMVWKRPFGKGIKDVTIQVGDRLLLIHNQYLTLAIAGGVLSLAGIGLWWYGLASAFLNWFRLRNKMENRFVWAAIMTSFCFYGTLLTIEFLGLLFFIIASMGIFVSEPSSLQPQPLRRFPASQDIRNPQERLSALALEGRNPNPLKFI
jgi:hypothetical protein